MEPLQDTDPRQIGPYTIVGLLGVGGMGRVYLGIDNDGTKAAVKVVNAELLRDEEFRKRFTREATATAKVRGRFIASIVAAEIDTAHPWLATEYIDGPALSDKVTKQGPLTAADAQQTAAGLAEALTTIHAAGVVHRDVKPANVLIAANGPHLIDFGIARDSAASTITRSGIVVGTPPYMAPEQIRGKKKVGPPADVFSLGGVLAFALTGRHPFGEGDPTTLAYRIAHEEPDLDGVADEVIRALIMTCLAKEPGDRPTATELQERLGAVATRPLVRAADDEPDPDGSRPVADMKATEPLDAAADGEPVQEPVVVQDPVVVPVLAGESNGVPAQDDEPSQDPAIPVGIAASEAVEPPPATPSRRRYLHIAAALASVVLVVILAVVLGDPTAKPGAHASTTDHTAGASTSSDSPSGSTGSTGSSGATTSPSGRGAAPPGSSSSKGPSPSGPGSGSQNPSSTTTGASNAPGTVASTTPSTHGTTAPPPPHSTSQPVKPPTSNPPARNTAPSAPANAADSIGWADSSDNDYQVTFHWSPVGNATSYDVHYTFIDGNGRTKTDEIDSTTATSFKAVPFSDPTAQACFVVRAVNAYGTSAWDSGSPHCI
jgi:serine/threonine protein kinase